MSLNYNIIGFLIVSVVTLYVAVWIFIKPVKHLLKILIHSIFGMFGLIGFNFLASSLSVATIGINIYNVLICGILGISGYSMLLFLHFFFK